MANIILLSDGTGNSAAKIFKTNVWRLYQALDLGPFGNQVAFYDDGVGTSSIKPLAVITGALGFGLKRNVKQLYKNLCQTYKPGDSIYAFGFSRGAFTIRVLAGLIASQGIIPGRNMDPQELRRAVEAAYKRDRKDYAPSWRVFRRRDTETKTASTPVIPKGHHQAEITFLGLWDTVDAYGLPIDEWKRGLDYWWLGLSFPDQDLSPIVKRACHALALDDKRRTFHPVLWNERFEDELIAKKSIPGERLKQVWFAGMHANVGGGYAKDGMSYVPLNWIIDEALAANPSAPLRFDQAELAAIRHLANTHADMGNSRAGLSSYYRYDPRRVSTFCNDDYNKVWIKQPKIHHSVLDRIAKQHVTYVPHMVPADYGVVGPQGAVIPNTYETPNQAAARNSDLERAWDLVWWRRLVYFITLGLTALLVLFPWIWEAPDPVHCTGRFCFLEPVIAIATGFLPSWLGDWAGAFRAHVGVFLLLAIGLTAIMLFGGWLERRIESRAVDAWSHVSGVKPANGGRWGPLSRIARSARTNEPLVTAYRWVAREFLPFLCFLATVLAAIFIANRLLFEAADAAGTICDRSSTLVRADRQPVPAAREFETSNPCFATGVELLEGRPYVVEIVVTQPWIDGTKDTSPRGFSNAEGGWFFRAATPLRRSWTATWFEPIGRIESVGRDHYRLRPQRMPDVTVHGSTMPVYASKPFIASNTGELFLFVNDAVVAIPGIWSRFYNGKFDDSALGDRKKGINNKGAARIIVRPVDTVTP
jgi:uncharacterized protein (DUF2235 family)